MYIPHTTYHTLHKCIVRHMSYVLHCTSYKLHMHIHIHVFNKVSFVAADFCDTVACADCGVPWWEAAGVVYICAQHFGPRNPEHFSRAGTELQPELAARVRQLRVGARMVITRRELPAVKNDGRVMVLMWQRDLPYTWGSEVTRVYKQTYTMS